MKKEYIKPAITGIYQAQADMAALSEWGTEDDSENYDGQGGVLDNGGPGFGGEDSGDDWGESV